MHDAIILFLFISYLLNLMHSLDRPVVHLHEYEEYIHDDQAGTGGPPARLISDLRVIELVSVWVWWRARHFLTWVFFSSGV